VRLKLVLRLILAFLFATFAAIYSQLIPPLPGEVSFTIRVLLTLAAGGIGYVVFPPIARSVRVAVMTTFNFVVHRVSSEVSNQIRRPAVQTESPGLVKPLILDTSAIMTRLKLDIHRL